MSGADFQALAVHLTLGVAVVVLMLTVSFRRSHGVAAGVTLVALVAALAAIGVAAPVAPRTVTPLLVVDGFGLYFAALFLLATLVLVLLSYRYLQDGQDDPEEYYLLVLAATLGATTLAGASHFASLLLGLEIMSIALYVLVAYPRAGHSPLEGALKYLVLSAAASTTILFGMALIYAATGTLDFSSLRVPADAQPFLVAGLAMVLSGVAFKLSLVPFHMWTPDVYQGAPAPVAGYLGTVAKGAVFAVLLRYLVDTGALADPTVLRVLTLLAVLSMLVGNLLALRQQHLKRVLAYSAIAHFGYLLIPLIALGRVDPTLAVEASLVYLGAYFAMTVGAFGVVTVLSGRQIDGDADALDAYQGLFWRRPALAVVFTVVLLSLAGIPLTVGFIGKFYLFAAGVSAANWLLLAALVAGSGIGLYYYLRIVFTMTRSEAEGATGAATPWLPGQWALGAVGLVVLLFGVYPTPLIDTVRQLIGGWSG
ncbi:MAG: NADH-quinone oxidoreductase subunit N [Pseudomonadales bacterium]